MMYGKLIAVFNAAVFQKEKKKIKLGSISSHLKKMTPSYVTLPISLRREFISSPPRQVLQLGNVGVRAHIDTHTQTHTQKYTPTVQTHVSHMISQIKTHMDSLRLTPLNTDPLRHRECGIVHVYNFVYTLTDYGLPRLQ